MKLTIQELSKLKTLALKDANFELASKLRQEEKRLSKKHSTPQQKIIDIINKIPPIGERVDL